MVEQSVLKPTTEGSTGEKEDAAPWIVRKLVGSITGRVVMASYETLKATGTSVICLSPWGDSSPLLLPCIRFRDLVVHTVVVATGGTAAFVTPALAPIAEIGGDTFASSIAVEVLGEAATHAVTETGNWLVVDKPLDLMLPQHSDKLTTTSVKTVVITLKYKHVVGDASLGYFRSPEHQDPSLISSVADYFAIENGWFSPYLFASGRRPVIPRTMKSDVIFAHGPFLAGDYEVAETLITESTMVLHFCVPPPPRPKRPATPPMAKMTDAVQTAQGRLSAFTKDAVAFSQSTLKPLGSLRRAPSRSASPSPSKEPVDLPDSSATPVATEIGQDFEVDRTDIDPTSTAPAPPRRMVIVLLGIKPHRLGMWTSSARPSESVMQYLLLNGCPAIVVPVRPGSPLLAWDTLTLAKLHGMAKAGRRTAGVVRVIFEFVDLCVDWERVAIPTGGEDEPTAATSEDPDASKKSALKSAIGLLVEASMKSADSTEVKKGVDVDRAGIVMFRLP